MYCKNCQDPIIVKYNRDRNNQFCSRECYNQYRRKGKPIKINLTGHHICLKCEKVFIPTRNTKGMYCSYACSNGAKAVEHKVVCKCCGRNFSIKNIAEIKRGHYQYCSNECRKRKYTINEFFFDQINSETAYWLGFIWSTLKEIKYNKIYLTSKKSLLERFSKSLNSNYPIRSSFNNKHIIRITSLKLVNRLVDLGIKESLFLEFPDIPSDYKNDFIRGYFDSDNGYYYKDGDKNVFVMHGCSSKLMRSISNTLDSKLVTDKGEWISISFDSRFDGIPKLEEKWIKVT